MKKERKLARREKKGKNQRAGDKLRENKNKQVNWGDIIGKTETKQEDERGEKAFHPKEGLANVYSNEPKTTNRRQNEKSGKHIIMATPKLLERSGNFEKLKKVLPNEECTRLEKLANNQLIDENSRPIYISQSKELGSSPIERYKNAGVNTVLRAAQPWLEYNIGNDWLVLSGKVLLRRTWPIRETTARNLGHNASNLTWHQDSNPKHGKRPMIVLMTFLQNGAGTERPGLSILNEDVKEFKGVYGYQGGRVDEFEREVTKNYGKFDIATPTMNKGDLLIFNGLTFHRTLANENMVGHRDALLIRVINPEHKRNFPIGQHLRLSLTTKTQVHEH